jgi:hypothetical protein
MTQDERTYQLTPADYLEANRGHMRSSRVRYLFLLIGIPNLAWAIYVLIWRTQPISSAGLPLAFGLFFTVGIPLLTRWNVQAMFRKQPNLGHPVSIQINPDGLGMRSDRFTGENKWSCYVGYVETPNLFMLYQGPRLFHAIPKRIFSDKAEVDEFRKLVDANVKKVQSRWSI